MKKMLFMLLAMALVLVTSAIVLAEKNDKALQGDSTPYYGNSRSVETEPNDDCTMADGPLFDGAVFDAEITPGDEDWFEIDALAEECMIFETHETPGQVTVDTKLYIFADDCITQLAFDDDGGAGLYSRIQYIFPADGVYYVQVIGYSGTSAGFYTLTADACAGPPPNDTCAGAIDLQVQGLAEFVIDLCDYINDYTPAIPSCTGYSTNGPDAVYAIDLLQGDTFGACEDPVSGYIDLAIWLVSDCTDPENTCVAGDDSGNPECVEYTAEADGTYYLIVDTYSGCGEVLVTIDSPVANDSETWGTVKSMYR
jgi:hypothetical protein